MDFGDSSLQKAYKYSLLYFLLFSFLLLTSSILLFEQKIGFSVGEVLRYYNGNEAQFIPSKSSAGILKIILPHIFGFGIFFMVLLHFLLFTKLRSSKKLKFLIFTTFIVAFLELFSPFLMIAGVTFFASVKLFSFVLLELLMLYLFWLLVKAIVYE